MSTQVATTAPAAANAFLQVAQATGGTVAAHNSNINQFSGQGGFLPYMCLGTGQSKVVKKGKLGLLSYGVCKSEDDVIDLGKTAHVWALGWRPKAMDFNGDTPQSYFDPNTDIFKATQAGSFAKDSNKMYGAEFLLFVPAAYKAGEENSGWCTLFMGSKTARNEARNIHVGLPNAETGQVPRPLALTSKLIETKEYAWNAIVSNISTQELELPSIEDFQAQLEKFMNPVDSVPVVAAPVQAENRG